MDFSWPKEYLDYKLQVLEFAKTLNDDIIERDKNGTFSREIWDKCVSFGLLGMASTKEYGGHADEVDLSRSMLAMEAFGLGCRDNGLALALNAQMWTVQQTILDFGSDYLKDKYLRELVKGNLIGAHAITEPGTGSDSLNIEMQADKVKGGYVLNGKKRLITLAPIADIAIVLAKTNAELGKWGISAFIIQSDSKGYKASKVMDKMGLRTVPIGEITLNDCFVPDENILSKEGMGFSIISHSLEYDRCCILASHIGAMERQINESIEYAKNRKQFGQAISGFQAVSHRIAEMKVRLETSRLLLYKLSWLKSNGKNASLEAAMLKLQLSESFVDNSLDAIRINGGIGYLTDTGVERDMRDAIGGLLYAGTSDIQRNIIAGYLGLK